MIMRTKWLGTCVECGGTIRRGSMIHWAKDEGASHAKCYRELPGAIVAGAAR